MKISCINLSLSYQAIENKFSKLKKSQIKPSFTQRELSNKNNLLSSIFAGIKQKSKLEKNNRLTIPIVTNPIIVYMATTEKTMADLEKNKLTEAANRLKPNDTAWNEKQSRNALKKAGITSHREQDKYIDSDGKLNTAGKKQVSFKGEEEQDIAGQYSDPDEISDTVPECDTISDKIPLSINIPDNIDFKQLDVSLPPDLQRAVDMSSIDSGDDLISTMFDYVPEDGYDLNKDLFDNFKEMLENLF